MNHYAKGLGILVGAATILVVEPPKIVIAQAEKQIQVQYTEQGLTLRLPTQTDKTPEISKTQEGNVLVADLSNVKLELGEDQEFSKSNPIPGIALLTISQYQSDSVRMIVQGSTAIPDAKIQSTNNGELVLKVTTKKDKRAKTAQDVNQASEKSSGPVLRSDSRMSDSSSNSENQQDVMVPNPEVKVEGQPSPKQQRTQAQLTPQQTPQRQNQPQPPQATPPPVGDIAVSNIDPSPSPVDLGVDKEVPRLVLRDAPVREVLSLLARSANLNLVYTNQQQEGEGESSTQQTISVDLEGEPVQRAFNAVLQMSGLEANRKGNTIFVGKQLPQEARNLVTRTFRLNSVTAAQAASFLATQGAATQQIFEDTEQIIGPEGNVIREDPEPPEIISVDVSEEQKGDNPLLLDGVSVSTDERLNSVTVVGTPKQVEIATQFLKQLDARRRQVAVNVQIIDLNLLETENFSNSFSFGVRDSFFVNDRGAAVLGFGGQTPPGQGEITNTPQQELPPEDPSGNLTNVLRTPKRFLNLLEAEITSGNAQILTDPTLMVKEGQTASVNLTQEVFGGIERSVEDGEVTIEPIIKDAGLTVSINVKQIDDNGFVTLNVNPTVSSPATTRETDTSQGTITLLQERTLTSGEIRLRDGETLIVAGIIQDEDRTTVSKVPILGDIPLLGALFRSTQRERTRREVIVLVTPKVLNNSVRGATRSVNPQKFSPETQKRLQQQRGNPQRRLPQKQQPQRNPQPQLQMPAPQQQSEPNSQ